MDNFWDKRYAETEFAYGTNPNAFLVEQLDKQPNGHILFACEGEGRNAVYAAIKGWQVNAFDFSEEGYKKATALAAENQVIINYMVADVVLAQYPENSFDAVALIYAHLAPGLRIALHQKCVSWLKPGGLLILEAFNPLQLKNTSGGPKDPAMLYTEEILQSDFNRLEVKMLTTEQTMLNEGPYHQGLANVVRFVGVKPK